ncbi:MAG: hypothetical protein K2Q01_05735 [Rickettsiales bacterium]|nr:hypothetical protein [Rickettsiales bacterium]
MEPELNSVIGLLGAFGLGSVFANLVSHWATSDKDKKTLRFNEKKEAYIGFLHALAGANLDHSKVTKTHVAVWEFRVRLVGCSEVNTYMDSLMQSEDHSPERMLALNNLQAAMRRDLKIEK